MVLNTIEMGESGPRVVFCHGLFGQGKNWTGIGKALAEDYRVVLVDLPDHGHSPRSERFDFLDYADRVAELLSGDSGGADPVALVGHSMGGKVAMLLALRHPELVERLVVVDVAPVAYPHAAEFEAYIAAMQAIDLEGLEGRGDADAALQSAVPNPMVRGFLLQSLRREAGGWRWLLNLDVLGRDLDTITDWPEGELAADATYPGKVLWVGGANSPYVDDGYVAAMDRLFPFNRRVTIKGAGHWVHSEQPEVFLEVLRRFLESPAQSD
ncbi:alpha/beta fold hydrolase [Nocardioides sp.]|uniref:alpha/beta fold hydrolase n=1 Tax=Nocardioides sp. TaxID=35761 RepID=UPI0035686407